MAEQSEIKQEEPKVTIEALIDFLEYEEALTTDKSTATRIRVLLKTLGVWK